MSSYESADSMEPTEWSKQDYLNLLLSFEEQVTAGSPSELGDVRSIITEVETIVAEMPEGRRALTDAANKVVSMTRVHEPEWWMLNYEFEDENLVFEGKAEVSWQRPIHFGCDRGAECNKLSKGLALRQLTTDLEGKGQVLIRGSLTSRKVHGEGKF
ncbi:hypothetical protein NCC49_004040 [Naganishia albida]|nr:hypothetical protein NCC49_004040 [Naganishia albida]